MKCKCGNEFKQYSTLDKICPACKIKALKQQKPAKVSKYPYQIQKFNSGAKTKTKRQKTEKQKAKRLAWEQYSRWNRLTHSVIFSGEVFCKCFTCGKLHPIKKMDCGHWIGRGHTSVMFNHNNTRPQCTSCNVYKQGMSFEFEQNLIEEIGREAVENLKELAKTEVHRTEQDYLEIAETYRIKVKQLQKEFGVKIW